MKCHILFSEKNKKNISKCRLLKILPRVLSVKRILFTYKYRHNTYLHEQISTGIQKKVKDNQNSENDKDFYNK